MTSIKNDYAKFFKKGITGGALAFSVVALGSTQVSANTEAILCPISQQRRREDGEGEEEILVITEEGELQVRADEAGVRFFVEEDETEERSESDLPLSDLTETNHDFLDSQNPEATTEGSNDIDLLLSNEQNESLEVTEMSSKTSASIDQLPSNEGMTLSFENVNNSSLEARITLHNEAAAFFQTEIVALYQQGEISFEELYEAYQAIQASRNALLTEIDMAQQQAQEDQLEFEQAEKDREASEYEAFLREQERLEAEFKEAEFQRKVDFLLEIGFLQEVELELEPADFMVVFNQAWENYLAAYEEGQIWTEEYTEAFLRQELFNQKVNFLIENDYLAEGFSGDKNDPAFIDAWQAYEAALAAFEQAHEEWRNGVLQELSENAAFIAFLIENGYLPANQSTDREAVLAATDAYLSAREAYDSARIEYEELLAEFQEFFDYIVNLYLPKVFPDLNFENLTAEQKEEIFAFAEAENFSSYYGLTVLNDSFNGPSIEETAICEGTGQTIVYNWGSSATITGPQHITGNPTGTTHFPGLGIEIYNGQGSVLSTITFTSEARAGFYEIYYKTTGNVIYAVIFLSQENVDFLQANPDQRIVVTFSGGTKSGVQGIMANPNTIFTPVTRPTPPAPVSAFDYYLLAQEPTFVFFEADENIWVPVPIEEFQEGIFERGTFVFVPGSWDFILDLDYPLAASLPERNDHSGGVDDDDTLGELEVEDEDDILEELEEEEWGYGYEYEGEGNDASFPEGEQDSDSSPEADDTIQAENEEAAEDPDSPYYQTSDAEESYSGLQTTAYRRRLPDAGKTLVTPAPGKASFNWVMGNHLFIEEKKKYKRSYEKKTND